jgi:hypothetical protein
VFDEHHMLQWDQDHQIIYLEYVMDLSLLSITLINILTPMSDISSLIICNCSYWHVSLFNVFNDTFGKQITIVGHVCLTLYVLLNNQYWMQLYM